MVLRHTYRFITWAGLMLLAFHALGSGPSQRASALNSGSAVIRLQGQLLEQASQRPLKQATILVKCGEAVLAHKQVDKKGVFSLVIPREKIAGRLIDIKIKYRDHVFVQADLQPVTQYLKVEINGSVFFENRPIADYEMSIHTLGPPRIGHVEVILPQLPATVQSEDVDQESIQL